MRDKRYLVSALCRELHRIKAKFLRNIRVEMKVELKVIINQEGD